MSNEQNNTTTNNNNNNNDNDNNNKKSEAVERNSPACSACKHQRKKCLTDCIFAPHFPSEKSSVWEAAQKTFGTANLAKMIRKLEPNEQREAIKSVEWEALIWDQDEVHGPYGQFRNLELLHNNISRNYLKLLDENNLLKEKYRMLMLQQQQQSSTENNANGGGLLSLPQPLPPQPPPPRPMVGNMTNYVNHDRNYYNNGVLTREAVARRGSSSNISNAAEARNYNVISNNHAQIGVGIGSNQHYNHVGERIGTSYNPSANVMHHPYPSAANHHLPVDHIGNIEREMSMLVYPNNRDQQLEALIMNSVQRNTPDNNQYSSINPMPEEDRPNREEQI